MVSSIGGVCRTCAGRARRTAARAGQASRYAVWTIAFATLLPAWISAQPADANLAQPARPAAAFTISADAQVAAEPGVARRFLRDVWSDYRNFLSVENAERAAVGGVSSLVVHEADSMLRSDPGDSSPGALKGGGTYGGVTIQVPLAVTWWIAGHAMGSARGENAGRDLVRAQISAVSWTYLLKYSVSRTRPNGDPRSFPSGHAAATFATALVLQEHYGWKLGVPMFAAATWTAAQRITENKHWASDVVFGATIGLLAGRTVTIHLRVQQLRIEPQPLAGGGGVIIRVL